MRVPALEFPPRNELVDPHTLCLVIMVPVRAQELFDMESYIVTVWED